MTFITANPNKKALRELTMLLFSVYPGSVVYEYTDAQEAFDCAKTHRIDRVFIDGGWDGGQEYSLLIKLREAYCRLPIYILGEDCEQEDEALWNEATGYFTYPLTREKLLAAENEEA